MFVEFQHPLSFDGKDSVLVAPVSFLVHQCQIGDTVVRLATVVFAEVPEPVRIERLKSGDPLRLRPREMRFNLGLQRHRLSLLRGDFEVALDMPEPGGLLHRAA